MTNIHYRGDIDSLRAIAVLSVVAFHAFPNTFTGGFVGVDVFFVISGYLITSKINAEIEINSFSAVKFYQNRIIRILPALILILIVLLFSGYFLLLEKEYRNIGMNVGAASIFISNFLSWSQFGYFDELSETKPLLHLWSLGVEEQFYIVFPVIFVLIHRFSPDKKLLLFSLILLISLLFSVLLTYNDNSSVAFYFPITRFFEFLIGALIALRISKIEKYLLGNKYKISGIFLLCAIIYILLIFKINKNTYFPGFLAALPCLVAALIISIGNQNKVSFIHLLLHNKFLKSFGLISYPIYLWHAPVYSIIRLYGMDAETRYVRIFAIIPILMISYLTYRFVELPIKHIRKMEKSTISIILIISLFATGAIGLFISQSTSSIFLNKKLYESTYVGDTGHAEYVKYRTDNFINCTGEKSQITCFENAYNNNDSNKIVILGDSHSDAFLVGLDTSLNSRKIINYSYYEHKPPKENLPLISNPVYFEKFSQLRDDKSVRYIVLSSYWSMRKGDLTSDDFYNKVIETIDFFESSGKTVYIYSDNPIFNFSPNACNGRRLLFGIERKCSLPLNSSFPQSNLFDRLERDGNIKIIDSRTIFCKNEVCSMNLNNNILYRDNDHLNIIGSRYLGSKVAHFFVGD